MPKSKSKKYYRNAPKAATVNNTPSASVNAGTKPAAAPLRATPAKSSVMVTSPTVGTELKVLGILTVVILAAIIVLSIVLR
ncbi:MAG: hypothetical protein PHE50_04000 [Dehalococcoidales bacterium]|nr:hypothetical protein [Dehalococcoidales bacterium]